MDNYLFEPSYEQLIYLNPRLLNRSKEEVIQLVLTIKELGYVWNHSTQNFYHPRTSKSLRTQGLDMFTPLSVRELVEEELDEMRNLPVASRTAGIAARVYSFLTRYLIYMAIFLLTFGWFIYGFLPVIILLGAMFLFWIILAGLTSYLHKPIRDYRNKKLLEKIKNKTNSSIK